MWVALAKFLKFPTIDPLSKQQLTPVKLLPGSIYFFLGIKVMSAIPMTVAGAKRLQEELHRLKHVERPDVINSIAEARAQGDLSENAEYDAARERQAFVEGRIIELDGTLSNAQVIDPKELDADGKVVFGATVDIEDLTSSKRVTYQIVGDIEADIRQNLISISSPVARSLIGKEIGDVVEVNAPSGVIEYEILDVRYI
jgi:transcription elongation factor GreA